MSDDTVVVRISDDYYLGEQFGTVPQTWWSAENVYEVPAEQVAKWEAAEGAWLDAQAEMKALMDARGEERLRRDAEAREREDARRAEIRRGLYGGRKS